MKIREADLSEPVIREEKLDYELSGRGVGTDYGGFVAEQTDRLGDGLGKGSNTWAFRRCAAEPGN